MPTPEEIKKLCEAYAEYMCPVGDYCGGVYDDQRNTDLPIYKDDAKSVIEWLCKTHCVVPKKSVAEWVNDIEFFMPDKRSVTMLRIGAKSLFGTALFNEEKE